MATWSAGSLQAACDARAGRLDGGILRIYTASFAVLLGELTLSSPAFTPATLASPSIAVANAVVSDPAANNTGVAAVFRQYQSDGVTLELSGTVTGIGGGGDMELVNPSITINLPIEVSSYRIVQP